MSEIMTFITSSNGPARSGNQYGNRALEGEEAEIECIQLAIFAFLKYDF